MPPPKVILGTNIWGERWTSEEEKQLPPILKELGIRQVDTAPGYPLSNPKRAEELLGELGLGSRFGLQTDSKVHYVGNGDGTVTEEAIEASLNGTLSRTKLDKLNILYLHGPDNATPLATQAAAIDALYRKNRFAKFGLCNFPLALVEQWLDVTSANGYVKPSVYQGQYNLLHRTPEDHLLPFLRKNDMTFVAHSPLAGGFLTGKLTFASCAADLQGTRFAADPANVLGNAFRAAYDAPAFHAAVREMSALCERHGVDMAEAATRWVFYHSALVGGPILSAGGDGVVIGPHDLGQLQRYAEAYMKGPMEGELVSGLEGLWEGVKGEVRELPPL